MILKQGRTFLLLAALACAALFLLVSGCNGDEKKAASGADPLVTVSGTRTGIGPDADGEGSLMYEEEPFPGFSDYLGQIDYAIAKALQLTEHSMSGLKVEQGPAMEHDGHPYHPSIIIIHGANIQALRQAINDSLLAWAERAALVPEPAPYPAPGTAVPPKGMPLKIVVDGAVTTHYIFISPDAESPRDDRPKLVIVMDDLGESKRQATRLLDLAFPVTFAVWPHSTHAGAVATMGHEAGAEVIVHQPMEPVGYPVVNPGDGVLLETMSEEEIISTLESSFALVPQATGFNNHMGSRLTQNEAVMELVSRYAASRGLLALDSLTHAKSRFSRAAANLGVRTYRRDVFLDVEADKNKIVAQLKKAEQIALVKGQAIAIGHPLSATLDALEDWQHSRDERVAIVRLIDLTPVAPSARQSGTSDKNWVTD